jgi:hypothetical protein
MAQPTPQPLDRGICAVFEKMIEQHGYQMVLTMAYADNPAGVMARQFFKQARRVTFIYHDGIWYSGSTIVDGPSKLTTLNPDMGSGQYPRPTVPDARGTSYKENGLACDKHRPRGIINTNGRDRIKAIDPDASPLDGVPFVAKPLKTEPIKAAAPSKPSTKEKVILEYTDKNGNLRKDAIDKELMDWCARQGFKL